jgi:transposase
MVKKNSKKARAKVEVDVSKLDQLVDKAELGPLAKEECSELKSAIHQLATDVARRQEMGRRQRSTEKAKKLMNEHAATLGKSPEPREDGPAESSEKPKREGGNGRRPASDYVGATKEKVPLADEFKPKQPCSGCGKGKFYPLEPAPLVRIKGLPPIQGTVYLLEKTRCPLCGEVHTAPAPEGIGDDKYDESVAAMIAILKYGNGMPFKRLETLQKQFGVPLPASTQFELVDDAADQLRPVYQELVRQAAQGEVATFDDTRAQILDEVERPAFQNEDRVGIKTTGVIVEQGSIRTAIFITGPQHAGENMGDLLRKRAQGLEAMVGMADASSQNNPKVPRGVDLLMAACITHGRRQFVNVFESFPQECWHVIEQLGLVYYHDKQCKDQELSKNERLCFHQQKSGPVMDELKAWMESQFSEKKTEPNSGLGKAIKYFLNQWERLTLFLRHPGSPLDSNIAERALKKAIQNRKNSFFFKTLHGAEVADLYLSLIHTCELNQVNPFDYLLQVLRHASDAVANPGDWLPWNFHLQLPGP